MFIILLAVADEDVIIKFFYNTWHRLSFMMQVTPCLDQSQVSFDL